MITHGLTLIVFIFCNVCVAQYSILELDVVSNKLLYNEHDNRIYASIPSANGPDGNSIGIINPQTVELETTVFVGSEPSEIALSDNGEFLYIGFTSSPVVKQFNVNDQTITQQFQLGTHYTGGQPLYAEDIEVMPGNPSTIAVARRRYTVSPRHGGVLIVENGTHLENTVDGHTGSNKIEFKSNDMLIGYGNESSNFELYELSVSDQGVTIQDSYQYVVTGFGVDILLRDNRLFSTSGRAFELDPSPYQAGTFNGASGPVHYNPTTNQVYYATSSTFGVEVTFSVFDAQTYLLIDELTIYDTSGIARSITGCGAGCYAFNTEEKIYILKAIETGMQEDLSKSDIVIHPNPTRGPVSIKSHTGIQSAELVDLSGKTILRESGKDHIDLTSLPGGLYILKVLDSKGNFSTHRVSRE